MESENNSWLSSIFGGAKAPSDGDLTVAKEQISAGKAVLVDVREQNEWDAGHVEGAILLPLSILKSLSDPTPISQAIPKDKVIYAHCVKGKRSAAAVEILSKFGFKAVSLSQNANDLIAAGFGKNG